MGLVIVLDIKKIKLKFDDTEVGKVFVNREMLLVLNKGNTDNLNKFNYDHLNLIMLKPDLIER